MLPSSILKSLSLLQLICGEDIDFRLLVNNLKSALFFFLRNNV